MYPSWPQFNAEEILGVGSGSQAADLIAHFYSGASRNGASSRVNTLRLKRRGAFRNKRPRGLKGDQTRIGTERLFH